MFLRDNPVINVNHPVNEKLQPLMPMWTEKYDQILYLDTDVFCWPEAPDLFEICPPGTFAITARSLPEIECWKNIKKYFGVDIVDKNMEGVSKDKIVIGKRDKRPLFLYRLKKHCYFNSGVFMVGGKEVGDEMMRHMNHRLLSERSVEAVLNFMVAASNVNVFEFSEKFNYTDWDQHDQHGKFGYFFHAKRFRKQKETVYEIQYKRALDLVEEWST